MTLDVVRFDDAAPHAFLVAGAIAESGLPVTVVRDFIGRFTLVVDDRESSMSETAKDERAQELRRGLRSYASHEPLLRASDLFAPESFLGEDRRILHSERSDSRAAVHLLDRTVVGEDWADVVLPEGSTESGSKTSRTAMYGFKGGVGRSTATFMLGRYLAAQGYCVLIVDLDLESPGVGPLLLDDEHLPDYGVIDYLVEAALDNTAGLDLVVRVPASELESNGELWVAPARGRGPEPERYSYVNKLNRVYADVPAEGGKPRRFAERLENAVSFCEKRVEELSRTPDVVLLDSRAGIHDIAAVAISRLSDLALLFAADNEQTWQGYRDLFQEWKQTGQAGKIREKLRVVASMVPASRRAEYLESLRDNAATAFSDLYDDVEGGEDWNAFNPSLEDESAPHAPVPILFSTDLVGLGSGRNPGWWDQPLVQAAYEDFLLTAAELVLNEES